MGSLVEWRKATGAPVVAGAFRVTPEYRALVVRLPFAVLVSNRPTAVVVEQDGQVSRVRIPDVTRIAQLVILGVALGLWLLARRAPVR